MQFPNHKYSAETDADLVAQYKSAGVQEVLGALYKRYMELVYGVCLKYLKNTEDAKDAVINIYEELTEKLRKYEVDNFKGWLYRVAKNHCLQKLRGNKARIVNIDDAPVYSAGDWHPEEVMQKENNLNSMHSCLEGLPAAQKAAVQLFYLQGKCYKDIAAITGDDTGKVRSAIQNGRRNLKICMEKTAVRNA